ncbi:MAG: hypothetical protein U1D55_01445 [Phycisphaerae bacterium]
MDKRETPIRNASALARETAGDTGTPGTGPTPPRRNEIRPGATGNDGAARKSATRNGAPDTNGQRGPKTERPARPLPDEFVDERDDVLSVINELEDQLDRYEEIRETLEREVTDTSEQLQTARQRAQELEWQVVTLQTRVEALEQVRGEVALLEEEIADANARVQRVTEQFQSAEKDNSRLTGELKNATKQLEETWAIRKERDGLRVDTKNLRTKAETLERSVRELSEDRAQVQGRLGETQAALLEAREARQQLEMELRAADDRNSEMRRAQDLLESKLEELRNEKKNFTAQVMHLERENSRLIEQQQFYECELTSLRSMNRNAEAALSNVKKAFSEVRVALAETKTRARRRTIESWPRTVGALRGLDETAAGETTDALSNAEIEESPITTAGGD